MNRDEFLAKLKAVEPTISKSSPVEIFSKLIFRNGRIETFNGTAGTSVASGLDFNFAVGADLIKKIADCYEELDLTQKNNQLRIKSQKYKGEESTQTITGFPEFLADNFKPFYDCKDLVDVLKATLISAKHKDDKYQGVLFHGNCAYSWDGFRATRVKLSNWVSESVFLPTDAAEYIVKKGEPSKVSVGNTFLAEWDEYDLKFCSKLLILSPKLNLTIDSMMPNPAATIFELPKELIDVVVRVGRSAGSNEQQKEVIIQGGASGLRVSARTEGSCAEEEIECEKIPDFKIAVSPSNFVQAMKLTRKVDLSSNRMIKFVGDKFAHVVSLFEMR